ncbi:hypothetical protein LVD17_10800 [Fulvivirga ulvae]|uniref:hypothetical protein n=1 Tax=Fulvivirga ulvae TaxID=2904245 RepID=UPI001F1791E1|nr:hypothetical protein [Fulvivirga ulvae]UII34297.1 hypothetical protein LVD17_10800 [Fulvivirga ulvae]
MYKIYFFENDLASFYELKKNNKNLVAIKFDSGEGLLTKFNHYINVENEIFVEESILNSIKKEYPNTITGFNLIPVKSKTNIPSRDTSTNFFISNDTHVYLFKNILKELNPKNYNVLNSMLKFENASTALNNLHIKYQNFKFFPSKEDLKEQLVVSNDWGPVERLLIYHFKKQNLPTYCLQESIIDFNDYLRRMEWCDYPIFQGIVSLKSVVRDVNFIGGNPRYEVIECIPRPSTNRVMINVNFTYGIFEEVRESWVSDIIDVMNVNKVEYIISQHPRDLGDMSKYNCVKSGAAIVHKTLQESSILISRFSSLIHEAIAIGRPVIYYNPHGEQMNYDFEPDGLNIISASNKRELTYAIQALSINNYGSTINKTFHKNYLARHIGITEEKKPSTRIAEILKSNYIHQPITDNRLSLKIKGRILRSYMKYLLNKING